MFLIYEIASGQCTHFIQLTHFSKSENFSTYYKGNIISTLKFRQRLG